MEGILQVNPAIFAKILLVSLSFAMLALSIPQTAYADDESSFYPSWKLMSRSEKRQFVAGYLMGFQDARVLGEVAVEYVKRNPSSAEGALVDLLAHYRLTGLGPESLVPKIDEFYNDTKNHTKGLRVAIGQASR